MNDITDEGHVSGDNTAQKAPGNSSMSDMRISLKRWLIKTSRNPFVTFSSLIQPVIFFVLMAAVLGAIVDDVLAQTVGDNINYITFLTPAIVIQSALAAAAVSGIGLVNDMDTGMFEKLLASPMDRGAMLLGKVLSEVIRIAIQTTIIFLLGYVMLYLQSGASVGSYHRTGLLGFVGVIAVAVIFGGAFMAFSNIIALITHDQEATTMIATLLTFPLLFISSAFVPLEVLPGWIQSVAVVNPITYGVDGVRAFMLGQDVMTVFNVTAFSGLWNTVIPAVTVLIGFNVVLGGIAVYLLNRASKTKVR